MREDEVICHWREVTQVKECTWQLKNGEVTVCRSCPCFQWGLEKDSLNLQLHKTSVFIYSYIQPEKCVLRFRKLCCPMSYSYQGSHDPSQTPLELMAYFCWTPFLQDPSLWGTFQDSAGDAEYIHFGKFLPKFLWGFLGSHSPNPANLHLLWTLLWARTCPMPLTPLPHLPQCLLACPMPLTPLPHLPQCPLACPMPLTPSPLLPQCLVFH